MDLYEVESVFKKRVHIRAGSKHQAENIYRLEFAVPLSNTVFAERIARNVPGDPGVVQSEPSVPQRGR